jgi:hypothetical protein
MTADFLGLPVDLQFVFLEPGVTEDDMLLVEPHHSELDALRMSLVVHHIDYTRDAARLVCDAVHIENQNRLRESLDQKIARDHVLRVDEVSSCSAVNQSFH